MMLWSIPMIYLIAGCITAIVTMRVFPPMEGFRPKLSLLLLAFSVFVLLWPVLVLLAIWYHLTSCLQRSRGDDLPTESHAIADIPAPHGVPTSKPR